MPRRGRAGYLKKLIAALDHEEPQTRVRAAWLLGEIGDRRAEDPLIVSLERHRDDPEFLATAVQALGTLETQSAIPSLIAVSQSSFLKARLVAVEVLAAWRERADVRRALSSARSDPSRLVREAAERALAASQPTLEARG